MSKILLAIIVIIAIIIIRYLLPSLMDARKNLNLYQKRFDFLNETLEYYTTDVSRRCAKDGRCTYDPIRIGHENSEGCAIGRHLTPEMKIYFDNNVGTISPHYLELLPPKLKELGVIFLRSIQMLHDEDRLWDKDGLNSFGVQYLNYIQNIIMLDFDNKLDFPKSPRSICDYFKNTLDIN